VLSARVITVDDSPDKSQPINGTSRWLNALAQAAPQPTRHGVLVAHASHDNLRAAGWRRSRTV